MFYGNKTNNASLMSPSINQSSRAGFLNETRISMQSSMLKTGEGMQPQAPSMSGASGVSASRNNQLANFNPNVITSQQARISSMNTSMDFKNSSMNTSLNGTKGSQNKLEQR